MRRGYFYGSALVLAAASCLGAAPPELSLPPEVKGEPGAFVSVPAVTTGKTVSWKSVDPGLNLFPVSLLKDTKTAVVSAAKPGRYRLYAVTAAGDEVSEIAETVVVIVGAAPPPPPRPDPNLDPKPGPPRPIDTPTKLFVVVVDKTADLATATRGRLLFDPAIAARFAEKGHLWRVVDKDVVGADGNPPADVARFLKLAAGKPYPIYFLVDADGKVRATGEVPAKASDLLDVVKRVGG